MNVRNAFAREKAAASTCGRALVHLASEKNLPRRQKKTWLPTGGATPDYNLREVVAERFMRMSETHDRIRTRLLATTVSFVP